MTFKQSFKIKYLDVVLEDNLNFKPHTCKLCKFKQKLYPIVLNFQRSKRKFNSPN